MQSESIAQRCLREILEKKGLWNDVASLETKDGRYIVTKLPYQPKNVEDYFKLPKKIFGYRVVFDWPEEYKTIMEGN
jgi:hypothetical protein